MGTSNVNRTRLLYATAGALCFAIGFAAAHRTATAQAITIYNAAGCHGRDMTISGNEASNSGTGTAVLSCPATRRVGPTNPPVDGWVWVNDQNPSLPVRCSLRVTTMYGTTIYYNSKDAVGTGYQQLHFDPVTNGPGNAHGLYCIVPAVAPTYASSVTTYAIWET